METFTKEELEVLINYLDRKIWRLEDSNLTDSYCYPKLFSARKKLKEMQKNSLQK